MTHNQMIHDLKNLVTIVTLQNYKRRTQLVDLQLLPLEAGVAELEAIILPKTK